MKKNKFSRYDKFTTVIGLALLAFAVCSSILLCRLFISKAPVEYEENVLKYSAQYNVPPSLIFSVINTESGFDKDAVSSAGARGLMQITPETFEWLQTKTGETLTDDDLFNPDVSIKYGTLFLSILIQRFDNTDTVAAAYNAGMNAVAAWLENPEYSDDGITLKDIPYSETSYYVVKINRALAQYKDLYD